MQQHPRKDREFLIRHSVQSSLISVGAQGKRLLASAFRPDPRALLNSGADFRPVLQSGRMRESMEESFFVTAAYWPVRWLRLAVKDEIMNEDAASIYLGHADDLGVVRHKREHFDEYIPLAKHAGKLVMAERDGASADPTSTIIGDDGWWIGNRVEVNQIIAAARNTHDALWRSGFWSEAEFCPFDLMD